MERLTEVSLDKEIHLCKNNAGPYLRSDNHILNESERKGLFVERVEEIIINKYNRFYAIGRPSDTLNEDKIST